jgi:hypothetical protein
MLPHCLFYSCQPPRADTANIHLKKKIRRRRKGGKKKERRKEERTFSPFRNPPAAAALTAPSPVTFVRWRSHCFYSPHATSGFLLPPVHPVIFSLFPESEKKKKEKKEEKEKERKKEKEMKEEPFLPPSPFLSPVVAFPALSSLPHSCWESEKEKKEEIRMKRRKKGGKKWRKRKESLPPYLRRTVLLRTARSFATEPFVRSNTPVWTATNDVRAPCFISFPFLPVLSSTPSPSRKKVWRRKGRRKRKKERKEERKKERKKERRKERMKKREERERRKKRPCGKPLLFLLKTFYISLSFPPPPSSQTNKHKLHTQTGNQSATSEEIKFCLWHS